MNYKKQEELAKKKEEDILKVIVKKFTKYFFKLNFISH
jgi:hypothetical protein